MSAAYEEDHLDTVQARYSLTEALRLAAAGYPLTAVTLTRDSEGKRRAKFHENWRKASAWSTDPDRIRDWWVEHPDTSYAVRTGASGGADVIDLDVKDGFDAVEWWAEQGYPVGSMIVDTISGGLHLYTPACGLPTVAGQFAPGVDTRGDGGLVFAPGAYIVGEPGCYRVRGDLVKVADLESLPADLIKAIKAARPEKSDHPADGRITVKDRDWMAGRTKAAVDKVADMPLHTDGSLFRDAQMGAAMMLGRLADAGMCDLDWARKQIEDATLTVWPDGLSEDDHRNIESGLRDGPRTERWRVREDSEGSTAEDHSEASLVLPVEVWASSDELAHIRQAALSAQVSPDVLLHVCMAILAAGLHHGVRLDTGRRPTMLGHYVAAVGPPGAGKSLALETGHELMAGWLAEDRFEVTGMAEDGKPGLAPIGPASGEGLIEALLGTVPRQVIGPDGEPLLTKDGKVRLKDTRVQVRHNGLISTDEAENLFKVGSRQGNTLIPVMRSMWSGSEVSTTTADASRNRHLPAGSYVLSALFGFQPGIIDPLFADENGGLPQRFVFAEAAHPDITEDEVDWPGSLRPDVSPGAFTLALPVELRAEVRKHAADRASGRLEAGPLDGHRMLLRCRVAALLALLHGSKEVQDYWDLAETLVSTSCALRDHLAGQQERRAKAQAQAREDAAVRTAVRSARESESAVEGDRLRRAADSIVARVEQAGVDGLSRGKAKNITGSLRKFADSAIEACLASGRLTLRVERRGGQEVEVLHVP